MEKLLEKLKDDLLELRGVNGVFVSRRRRGGVWTNEPVIQFHVVQKKPVSELRPGEMLPPVIEGIGTDVITANPVLSTSTRKRNAAQGGLSCGVEDQDDVGTITLFVSLSGDIRGIASAHTLLVKGASTLTLANYVLHPGIDDGGRIGYDRIGVPLSHGLSSSPYTDSALFSVDYPYALSVFNLDVLPKGVTDPQVNDVVRKVGRTTGLTEGKVSGLGYVNFNYGAYGGGSSVSIYVASLIPNGDDPNEIIAWSGDSGALWYYPSDGDAMGIHIAHALAGGLYYACRFSDSVNVGNLWLPDKYDRGIKGAMNLAEKAVYEMKGSANLSGSGPPLIARLTASNQDRTLGFDSILTVLENAGITYIRADGGSAPDFDDIEDNFSETPSPPVQIPDGYYVTDTISVSGIDGVIKKLEFEITLQHDDVSVLKVSLVSPSSTEVVLIDPTEDLLTGSTLVETVFDDDAYLYIDAGDIGYRGEFRGNEALSGFDDEDPNGTWTLYIEDTIGYGYIGYILNWKLKVFSNI